MMVTKSALGLLLCSSAAAFHSTPLSLRPTASRSPLNRPNQHGSAIKKYITVMAAGESDGKVVIVGSINQDLKTYAPSLPAPGETILGSEFTTTAGGKGGNQAAAAASIGIVSEDAGVHMIGRVGEDAYGDALLTSLKSFGVNIDEKESKLAGEHTGIASIIVDSTSGQNTIVVAPGANFALTKEDVKSSLSDLLGGSDRKDVVVLQLEIQPESALQSLQTASELGAITILNPAPAPEGWKLDDKWFASIDVLIPNETELATLCGVTHSEDVKGEGEVAMAKSLLEKGVRQAVIVTLGSRGAMIVTKDDTIMISEPPENPAKLLPVEDAVGAGDAFCGSLAAYLSRGVELEKAASMACGVASTSVRKKGAQESYPSADEMPDCLKVGYGDQFKELADEISSATLKSETTSKNA